MPRRYDSNLVVGLVLAAATFAAFTPACRNGFTNYDDDFYVTANPDVKAGLTRQSFHWAWTTIHASNWHPLTWLSLQTDAQVFGKAWGYHLTNVLLHTANVVLLFLALRRMTGAIWRSALVAALFGLHPLHVESVAWVAERKDVLSTFFWMLTLLAYAWYADRPGIARYVLVVSAFSLGLLAKPMLVTLPCVLLLLDYWPLGRWAGGPEPAMGKRDRVSAWRLAAEKAPLLALSAASCAVTWYAQRQGQAVKSLEAYPSAARVGNALVAYVGYLGKTLWPMDLMVFYPHRGAGLPAWQAVAAGVLLAAVTVAVLVLRRRFPYLAVGWLWYLGTLVPVIGLVQVGIQAMADRYTYVPLVGLFVAAVWGAADLAERVDCRKAAVAAGVVMVAACTVLTMKQVRYWEDSETLWQRAIAVEPGNSFAHYNLATFYEKNRPSEALKHYRAAANADPGNLQAYNNLGTLLLRNGQMDQALERLRHALTLDPDNVPVNSNLGLALFQTGRLDEAERHERKALELNPDMASAHNVLGAVLVAQGRPAEAEHHFREAVRLNPDNGEIQANLGLFLLVHGKGAEAEGHLEEAARLQPDSGPAYFNLGRCRRRQERWADAATCFGMAVKRLPADVNFRCNLAFALDRLGRNGEAAEEYREASRLAPNWTQSFEHDAWARATHPDEKVRDGLLAVELAEMVCDAPGGREANSLDVLAAAYAEAGRLPDAVRTAREALRLARSSGPSELAGPIEERLKLYEQGRPYREGRAEGGKPG